MAPYTSAALFSTVCAGRSVCLFTRPIDAADKQNIAARSCLNLLLIDLGVGGGLSARGGRVWPVYRLIYKLLKVYSLSV